ncbi:hypothetical protein QTP86_032910, partial [Hemibagrus guttatus]
MAHSETGAVVNGTQVSYIGHDCELLPEFLADNYGSSAKRLDLSFNRLSLRLPSSTAIPLINDVSNSEAAAHSTNGISSANSATGSTLLENAGEENSFIISEHDVRKAFRRVKTRKAAGPDGITGRVLKACAVQLAPVFTEIFNLSLEQSMIPTCFKQSTIVPVPKKHQPACLNDYCPVDLTSAVMKCFERLIRDFITSSLPDTLDPLQFAYLLTTKLEIQGLSPSLCRWISNFLTDRPQAWVGKHVTPSLTLSTGAPQGCVLSSLNSLYTYDCVATSSSTINNDETAYLEEIKNLEAWCQDNNLLQNISKTKELIVDFSTKQERSYQPLIINWTPVERAGPVK